MTTENESLLTGFMSDSIAKHCASKTKDLLHALAEDIDISETYPKTMPDFDRLQMLAVINMNYHYGSGVTGQPVLPAPPSEILGL